MRIHGLQPPYDLLQVVAISTFASLSVAFYVFSAPFVGKRKYEHLAVGFYTPLVASVLFLYIWCSSINPVDSGVMKSKKDAHFRESRPNDVVEVVKDPASSSNIPLISILVTRISLFFLRKNWAFSSSHESESLEKQSTEDGVFYCKLCESEVSKDSKHCRVCDKCVSSFDHHCRWLNTCIGRKNYWCFFALMVSSLLLLVLQFSIGIIVLVRSFLELNRFNQEIELKLGASFTFIPFVIIIVLSTIMAMAATFSLSQLFLFHFLLLIKGITTYDYIMGMREKAHEASAAQQTSYNSPFRSYAELSDSSSNTLNPAAWCSPPPHWFANDEFNIGTSRDKIPMNDVDGKIGEEDLIANQVRRESKLRQKVPRWKKSAGTRNSDDRSRVRVNSRFYNRRRAKNRSLRRFPTDDPCNNGGIALMESETLADLARLRLQQLKSTSHVNRAAFSSPETSSTNKSRMVVAATPIAESSIDDDEGFVWPSRSSSDGYEASGGEDSDRIPSRIIHRYSDWSGLVVNKPDTLHASDPSFPN